MLTAKTGDWWSKHPHRGRSNNSCLLLRNETTKEEFDEIKKSVKDWGDPGFIWCDDLDSLFNPCVEIQMYGYSPKGESGFGVCNLVEVHGGKSINKEIFYEQCKVSAIMGTLQAGYTDFHYLRDIWKRTAEKEALLGVSMTGIASGAVLPFDLNEASKVVVKENIRVADLIGIKSAARTTSVKPSGTSSLVVGSSSGIHAWHAPYYIRRIRVGKNESIYRYLADNHPELIEDEFFRPTEQAVISVPVKAPDGAIFRDESPLELLERVKRFNTE